MLCALLLRPPRPKPQERRRRTLFDRLQDRYAAILGWSLDHEILVLAGLAAVIALNVWLILIIPKGFFPQQDTGRMIGSLQADQDISFPAMSAKLSQMMAIVQHDPAVRSVVGYTGQGSGGGAAQTNTGNLYISLKPLGERDRMPKVISRLRRALSRITGARLFLQGVQDIRVGGRQSNAQYQYTIEGDSSAEVYQWAPKLLAAIQKDPTFVDVSSDQQQKGGATNIAIDRTTASRLGLTMYQLDNTLYDAFGQRSVSTIYNALNQYYVVMEVAPKYTQRADMLDQMQVSTAGAQASGSQSTAILGALTTPAPITGPAAIKAAAGIPLSSQAASATNLQTVPTANSTVMAANPTVIRINPTALGAGAAGASTTTTSSASSSSTTTSGSTAAENASESSLGATGSGGSSTASAVSTSVETMVPLPAVAAYAAGSTPLSVNHQSGFVATTISFNLPASKSLSDAQTAIAKDQKAIGFPSDLIGGFAGTALVYEQSLSGEVLLVAAAIVAIYIVLGILYESFAHPLTILSTLPSATLGGVLALLLLGIQFTIIALIGMILLIGIVKKNAILMIDFALKAEREEALESREAIFQAAITRFRPIMMTTTAAILGALPLCFSFGVGSELRQPLGVTIVGGLLVSQALTLFTTPVVYLAMDRLRLRATAMAARRFGRGPQEGPAPAG
jgi:multidrug efflux pump subunit AcrB